MKGGSFLNSFLDPIARVWGSGQPALLRKHAEIKPNKAGIKKSRKTGK
jgi:hypothetical protein